MPAFRIIIFALLFSDAAHSIEFIEIGPQAWAAIQPAERRFNDCNSLIVEAAEFVIVVDAQESEDDVRQISEFARDKIGKPVAYLINTHWHSDHTQGNTLYRETFGENLVIIGHTTHQEDIEDRAATYLSERVDRLKQQIPEAQEQLDTGVKKDGSEYTSEETAEEQRQIDVARDWVAINEKVVFTGPSLAIDGQHAVLLDDASFVVHPMRGHTRGDLVVHFPKLDLVATGDLVDAMPYSGHGFPSEWLTSLGRIRGLGASNYVPGHGPLLTNNLLIDELQLYFSSLTEQVKAFLEDGKSTDEIVSTIDLSDSRQRLAGSDEAAMQFFDRVQEEAIQRAIAELSTD